MYGRDLVVFPRRLQRVPDYDRYPGSPEYDEYTDTIPSPILMMIADTMIIIENIPEIDIDILIQRKSLPMLHLIYPDKYTITQN